MHDYFGLLQLPKVLKTKKKAIRKNRESWWKKKIKALKLN